MRGLFFKVFIILWIAQSLIFVISTALIVRHHLDSPDVFFSALDDSLRNEARHSANAYESGGCIALAAYARAHQLQAVLANAAGADICDPSAPSTALPAHPNVSGRQVGQNYVWTVPVISGSGHQYFFRLSRPHVPEKPDWGRDLLHFAFPQLPVAIVIGGATTFVLVLLITRPVMRLREAAHKLAQGNLSARVTGPDAQSRRFEGDEIQALVHDFNHMAERLESLVNAQKLLLRDVSHELRSPLARLSVALELAREDAEPAMAAHLQRIQRETELLNQLIGQLLTLSSLEAMEKFSDFAPLSLNHLVEEMVPDATYEAQQRQCSVVLHTTQECVVLGNPQLLHRAIENVLRNAIRYTQAGTEVEINLTKDSSASGEVVILDVNDHGPGIPDDELNAVFLPFHRVDASRSTHTGGFGVGLAIADRAVKLHGGELRAFNRREGGATIRMKLPAMRPGTPGNTDRPVLDGAVG